ncbi:MAG: quinone-dependent dihydroorotate dehydrogenase [Chitinophagaceae bacterium]
MISARNLYLRNAMYNLLRSILFLFDAEKVHYFSMGVFRFLCGIRFLRKSIHRCFTFENEALRRNVFSLEFTNPVGLGAGFDKNAIYLRELSSMGFGFVEIGTVTPRPQRGNDKPRLFRLPADKALINRMGFNNDGVKKITERLREWRTANPPGTKKRLIIGGNIGKNKDTPNEDAWMDYEKCFQSLFDYVDYFVVNVSSPNTPGLRALQEKDALNKILSHLQSLNNNKPARKPILLKIAPDLSFTQLDDIIELAKEVKLDGLVATNTTIDRTLLSIDSAKSAEALGAGGLSGAPLRKRSTEVVAYIAGKTAGKLPIIASGGIFSAADATEKIAAGACLVQVWTGFIYEGPGTAKKICTGLI